MSAALETMTDDELAQLDQMRADDAADTTTALPPVDDAPASTQQQPAEKPDRTVPIAALHEERKKRQALDKELANYRERAARIEERFELLRQAAEQHVAQPAAPSAPAAPAAPPPKWEEDPAGYINHNFSELRTLVTSAIQGVNDRLGKVETGATQLTQQQQVARATQELQQWASAQEDAFRAANPDYADAANYVRQKREAILSRTGLTGPALKQAMANEVFGTAAQLRQNGGDFAEAVYAMAQDMGWQPGQGGASPAATTAAASAPTAAERLIRGADMANTIGSTGAAPRGGPAPQRIADMSEAEFNAYYAKVSSNPAALRALFGE